MNPLFLAAQACALLLLLALSAFFSSSETALFSLDPIDIEKLRKRNRLAADRTEKMLQYPTRLLSTILIGNTLVNVVASAVGFGVIAAFDVPHPELLTIPAMTVLLLIFGEVAPKRIAIEHPHRLAQLYAAPLTALIYLMTPIRKGLERISALFAVELKPTEKTLSEDEFLSVVDVGEEEGVLDPEEHAMVNGIIGLEETQACDVLTPRVDLVGIDLNDPPENIHTFVASVRFRFVPLYRDTLDAIEAFLDVAAYLIDEPENMDDATIPAAFVPETAPLDTLLTTFQQENRRVAVVVDEYGGTAGLITRGDILEEIADDVDNEFGDEGSLVQPLGEARWLIDGTVSIEDANYDLDLDLEAEGADRIAGWITAQAEHIPFTGEVIEAQGVRATAQRVRHNRVMLVLLEKLPIPHSTEEQV
jgi:putative hemolysin